VKLIGPTEAAANLGITRQALSRIAKDPACPVDRNGSGTLRYRWPDLNLWYMARKVAEAKADVRPADYEQARARQMEADADMAEWKRDQLAGKLMTTEQFRRVKFDTDARVGAKLKNLATKLAPLLVGCESEAEVMERSKGVLAEVMDELYRADDLTDDQDAAA
jgi:hypothetical protein